MINGIERVGIYGGMFAPIHNGHIAAARAFVQQMKLDKLLIVPTKNTPRKVIDFHDDPRHRFNMCKLAFEQDENIEVSAIELEREGISYTVDTLRALQAPNVKLFFLCGTDMMLCFDRWREVEEIFKLCCPIYIRRETNSLLDDEIIAKNREYFQKFGVAFRKILVDPIELSSSEIRNVICAGGDISEMVPDAVMKYIYEHKLYE